MVTLNGTIYYDLSQMHSGITSNISFNVSRVTNLRESEFTLGNDYKIDIVYRDCVIILFYSNNVESEKLASVWSKVANSTDGPIFAACNLHEEPKVATAFTSLAGNIHHRYYWARLQQVPFILVYRGGSPIGFYNDVRSVEKISNYAITLACNANYEEHEQLFNDDREEFKDDDRKEFNGQTLPIIDFSEDAKGSEDSDQVEVEVPSGYGSLGSPKKFKYGDDGQQVLYQPRQKQKPQQIAYQRYQQRRGPQQQVSYQQMGRPQPQQIAYQQRRPQQQMEEQQMGRPQQQQIAYQRYQQRRGPQQQVSYQQMGRPQQQQIAYQQRRPQQQMEEQQRPQQQRRPQQQMEEQRRPQQQMEEQRRPQQQMEEQRRPQQQVSYQQMGRPQQQQIAYQQMGRPQQQQIAYQQMGRPQQQRRPQQQMEEPQQHMEEQQRPQQQMEEQQRPQQQQIAYQQRPQEQQRRPQQQIERPQQRNGKIILSEEQRQMLNRASLEQMREFMTYPQDTQIMILNDMIRLDREQSPSISYDP
jgi:hypothetical protein